MFGCRNHSDTQRPLTFHQGMDQASTPGYIVLYTIYSRQYFLTYFLVLERLFLELDNKANHPMVFPKVHNNGRSQRSGRIHAASSVL